MNLVSIGIIAGRHTRRSVRTRPHPHPPVPPRQQRSPRPYRFGGEKAHHERRRDGVACAARNHPRQHEHIAPEAARRSRR